MQHCHTQQKITSKLETSSAIASVIWHNTLEVDHLFFHATLFLQAAAILCACLFLNCIALSSPYHRLIYMRQILFKYQQRIKPLAMEKEPLSVLLIFSVSGSSSSDGRLFSIISPLVVKARDIIIVAERDTCPHGATTSLPNHIVDTRRYKDGCPELSDNTWPFVRAITTEFARRLYRNCEDIFNESRCIKSVIIVIVRCGVRGGALIDLRLSLGGGLERRNSEIKATTSRYVNRAKPGSSDSISFQWLR